MLIQLKILRDEGQSQAEEGATQAEIPTQPDAFVAEPAMPPAEPMPDVYEAPDAESETAEETGVFVPPAEPQAAEPAPDAVSVTPVADASVAEEAGPVIVPPVDATVSSPETDTAVYVDVPPAGTDTSPDTPAGPDTQPDSPLTETPSSQDSADSASDTATDTKNTDTATGTDTPVQGQDAQKDTPQGKPDTVQFDSSQPDSSQPDANQPAGKDTENPQPKPEDKNEGGGGCSCAIENPDNPSVLNYLVGLGIAAALAISRRKKMAEVLQRK